MKNLHKWEEVIPSANRTEEEEEFLAEQGPPQARGIWEILDWVLWEKGNLVELDCGYPIINLIRTKRPFETVLEQLCLVAYTLHLEWLKKDSPFLKELGQEIRIYFMKMYAIKTSAYQEGTIPPTDEGFAHWADNELDSFMKSRLLSFEVSSK